MSHGPRSHPCRRKCDRHDRSPGSSASSSSSRSSGRSSPASRPRSTPSRRRRNSSSSHWTPENYADVQERSDYFRYAINSIILAGGSTLLGLIIAVPAAWSMAFSPTKRTKDLLMWMLSTKMMPAVGVLVPIYLIFRNLGLLDTHIGLIVVLVPRQPADRHLDALHLFQGNPERHPRGGAHGRRDARGRRSSIVLTPMAVPGIASTMLLNIILAWNEAFWTLNLTDAQRGAADRVHRLLLQPRGPVLGQAVGGLDARHRADPDARLVQPAATGARPHLRRGQVDQGGRSWARSTSTASRRSFGNVDVIQDVDLDDRRRRLRRLRRPVGLRQVDAAAPDRRARGRHRRRAS